MVISDVSIRRPVTTLTVTAALLIFGWIAFKNMGIDLYPEVDLPFVTVSTVLVGASPEVIDQNVTDVLEEQIKTISGIKNITSMSFEGYSRVFAEFELGKNVDVAAEEVRAKVNLAKTNLPDEAEDPLVDKVDISGTPILWIAVVGNVEYQKLSYYADKVLKEQLQSVSGVGNIEVTGLREREIRVWLDPQKLEARNITALDVIRAIKSKHVELPGGRVETESREFSVKVEGEYKSAEELSGLVVAERDGAPVYLKDLGRVDDSFEDNRTISRFNGITSIGLGIRKQSGTNTVAVADAVLAKLAEIKKTTPPGISVNIAFDSSDYVRKSIRGVEFDIIFGVILTALVMYIFLRNVRITIISVVSIPVSLIGGFIVMNALGFTANFMTMLAMSLSVGMVIDDTIVVLENIFRHVEAGVEPMKASKEGTDQVGLAVLAATSSIAAVFLPVAFMKGIIGRFFFQFGLTVALTIIISAFVSLTLTPFLSSRLMHHQKSHRRIYVLLENFFVGLENGYRRTLGWAVNHRWTIVGIAALAFVGGMSLVKFIGTEFTTKADESRFMVRFELPTGTSIQVTDARMRELESVLLATPEVDHIYTATGESGSTEVNKGTITVILKPKEQRKLSQDALMKQIREKFNQMKDINVSLSAVDSVMSGRSADIQFVIQGPSVADLARVGDQIVADLKQQPGFTDLDTDLRLNKPEIKVGINRNLANDLGVDVMSISNEIYTLFGGVDAAKFKEGGYRYNIRVRALPDFRATPEDLEHIVVRAGDGRIIKAANLINIEVGQGPNTVNRHNRMRAITIYANVGGIPMGEGLERIEAAAAKYIPRDGNWSTALTGKSDAFRESFQYLLNALLIAILVIYMILAIQFESFVHPFTIMISLPLTMIGVFGALLITGKTLNIFSFIGIIMLMGIVTKNAILLVDFANQERQKGVDKVTAMLTAGPVRLRPILMTAIATIIGVFPVALALSEGGETRAPMAIAVIGGVITSTFLTLIVIPVVYLMLDDALAGVGGRVKKLRAKYFKSTGNGVGA